MKTNWLFSCFRKNKNIHVNNPLIIEQTYAAAVSKVWKAITDKTEMKQWYFEFTEFIPKVGFSFQFTGGPEDRQYLHLCQITAMVENKKLAYSWRYDGYEGNSIVTLLAEGNNTRLKLTHEGLESFPKSNPDFAMENFIVGWTEITSTSLKSFLEKGSH